MQEIQFLEFMGGSNLMQASPKLFNLHVFYYNKYGRQKTDLIVK